MSERSGTSAPLLDVVGGDLKPAPPPFVSVTTRVGLGTALAYALSYFWRYPIFILPKQTLGAHVVTIGGTPLDLQACFSMAFILGFGAAKIPLARFVSSAGFFRHRLRAILAMLVLSMLVECVGVWAFGAWPAAQAVCVFASSFLSSGIYGSMFTFLEGRRSTETLLAIVSAFLIYAGNLARGCASWVLSLGVPPLAMPLAIGLVACPLSCALTCAVAAAPGPSAADHAMRSKRSPMTSAQRRAFVARYGPGLLCLLLGYAILTGLRSYRDFYATQIFAASLGAATPPAYLYFVADLPGSLFACLALVLLNAVGDNRRCIRVMLLCIVGGAAWTLLCTLLFRAGWLPGAAWQLSLGVGIYVAYTVYGAPLFDRLLAASQAEGTATFLVFLADFCGYVVTISLLLLQNFGPMPAGTEGAAATILRWYELMLLGGAAALGALGALGALYFGAVLAPPPRLLSEVE